MRPFPRLKEHIIIDDYEFEILGVSDTRIEMVKMKLLKQRLKHLRKHANAKAIVSNFHYMFRKDIADKSPFI